jgi:hypothetical protein
MAFAESGTRSCWPGESMNCASKAAKRRSPSDGNGGLRVGDDVPNLYGAQLLFGLALCANGLDAFLLCGSAIDRRASNGRPGLALARMSKCPSSPS